ncbi:hypothetical protein GSY69_00390 [Brevibacterium sp. 5221]|uniref:Uncharacterized protein n=1 Tax=Brevibacterium rongguiense TaxID=2695267 RepID=A0A6N9H367_9MICO|nr:hypothetical protein [Brevibacterium rongguiense]MYM18477.1 hypothetical protein [Brevibacterium rongguiense]
MSAASPSPGPSSSPSAQPVRTGRGGRPGGASTRLSAVALALSIVALVGFAAAGAAMGFVTTRWQQSSGRYMSDLPPDYFLVANGIWLSFALWGALGTAGLVCAIVALVKRQRKGRPIVAIVCSVLAPGVGFAAFALVALVSASAS